MSIPIPKGLTKLGPGIYADEDAGENILRFDVGEYLATVGTPDTPENHAAAVKMMEQTCRKLFPNLTTHHADGPLPMPPVPPIRVVDAESAAKVRLIQVLCPARHCIIATAYEREHHTAEDTAAAVNEAMVRLGVHRHCGLCGSQDLAFEDAPTAFATMQEAMPALKEMQAQNLAKRQAIHRKAVLERAVRAGLN